MKHNDRFCFFITNWILCFVRDKRSSDILFTFSRHFSSSEQGKSNRNRSIKFKFLDMFNWNFKNVRINLIGDLSLCWTWHVVLHSCVYLKITFRTKEINYRLIEFLENKLEKEIINKDAEPNPFGLKHSQIGFKCVIWFTTFVSNFF